MAMLNVTTSDPLSVMLLDSPGGESLGTVLVTNDPQGDINRGFLLTSAYLVFFMQAGFAMLSAGSVRAKNTKTIILKNLLDSCIGAVCFWLVGFAFAFGGDLDSQQSGNTFIGHANFAFKDMPKTNYAFWFFQYAFASAASSIVSGAVEERMSFSAYMLYAVYLISFVYPVVAHWVWSTTGWLSAFRLDGDVFLNTGMIDFAGCGVVHMVGGFTGLVGAWVLGPRIGRFSSDRKPVPMPGHSASLCILGVFLLWFGWYGFNPGSTLIMLNGSAVQALAAVNTTMSAACATLSALATLMLMEYMSTRMILWDLIGCANGTLAGLVAITASCAFVETWAAMIIGVMAGIIYTLASFFVLNILKIDDPLDAVAVHGFNGVWGLIAAAAFATEAGLASVYPAASGIVSNSENRGFIMGGNGRLLACAIIGVITIFAWVLATMVPFFVGLKALGLLRVSPEEEVAGLDVSHHGGSAYNGEMPETTPAKKTYENENGGMTGQHDRVKSLEQTVALLTNRLTHLEGRNQVTGGAAVGTINSMA